MDDRTWPELTPGEQRAVLDSIVTMVLVMGGTATTAYLVAAEMAAGLDDPGNPRLNARLEGSRR